MGETNHQSFWMLLPKESTVSRDDLIRLLTEAGISVRRGIMAAHLEPAYAGVKASLPVTERLTRHSLISSALPSNDAGAAGSCRICRDDCADEPNASDVYVMIMKLGHGQAACRPCPLRRGVPERLHRIWPPEPSPVQYHPQTNVAQSLEIEIGKRTVSCR